MWFLLLTISGYRFSAFWLRSSVVSVLISLISDTCPTRAPYIKLIFGAGRWNRGLLRPLHASTRYCSTSGNGAPPKTVNKRICAELSSCTLYSFITLFLKVLLIQVSVKTIVYKQLLSESKVVARSSCLLEIVR